jgi:hypothetical protein
MMTYEKLEQLEAERKQIDDRERKAVAAYQAIADDLARLQAIRIAMDRLIDAARRVVELQSRGMNTRPDETQDTPWHNVGPPPAVVGEPPAEDTPLEAEPPAEDTPLEAGREVDQNTPPDWVPQSCRRIWQDGRVGLRYRLQCAHQLRKAGPLGLNRQELQQLTDTPRGSIDRALDHHWFSATERGFRLIAGPFTETETE